MGLFIGDALAMPVHWYYNRRAMMADYGWVTDFMAPQPHHPDSVLWRSAYQAQNAKGDILHDQARYWGRPNIHYHQFLKAGENTLNIKISRLLIDSLNQNRDYDQADFLNRYIAFMTTPGNHRDTYIEECHRNFFSNFARGVPPAKCGVAEKHIGGLVGIVPIVVFYRNQPELARRKSLIHLSLTHPGARMREAGQLIADLLLSALDGTPLRQAIERQVAAQANPLVGHPFFKWLDEADETVLGRHLSTACYVEHAVPAVIYLALKHCQSAETALIANTNLGGDNAGRGAILGALLGAAYGIDAFPSRWCDNLLEPPPELGHYQG